MATYYWVGGTGNWDATTTHWSTVSGGAGGSGPPTSADDVVFDSLSNSTAYTVTLLTTPVCRSVSVSMPLTGNITVAGSAAWSIYGSLTVATGITYTYSGAITFAATTTGWTINTGGVTLSNAITFNGVGGGWTLAAALNAGSGSITVTSGSFATGNFTLSANSLISIGSATRSISLGSSNVTLISNSGAISLTSTGLTWNAGTSNITLSGYAASISAYSGIVFNNVTFTRTSSADGTDTASIGQVGCTFNTLTISTPTTGVIYFNFPAGTTNVSTLSVTGFSISTRTLIKSSIVGSTATINLTNNSTIANADFRDITVSGAGSITSAVGCGDCGGNSGIPFPAAKTVYWNLAGSNSWSSNGWATTQTGIPALANFPLAQDTALFTNTNPAASAIITLNGYYNLPTVSFAARTLALTFATGTKIPICYGDTILSTAITLTGTGAITYGGRGNTQTITSAGRTWTQPLAIANIGGTVRLSDACTRSSTITHSNGTFDLNNFALTGTIFSSSNTNARTLNSGSTGTITVTASGTVWNTSISTSLSIAGSDPKIYVTNATAVGVTVTPGSSAASSTLNFYFTAGTYTLTITTSNSLNSLDFTGFAGTLGNTILSVYGSLKLSTGMTLTAGTSTWTFASSSAGKTLISNGKTMDFPVTFNGAGGGWILQDAMTVGATRTVTLSNGTLDLNGFTFTANVIATGAGTKNLTFNGGTFAVTGSSFNNSAPTGFTTTAGTGAGTITMTSAVSKTFAGGGSTYNCTLNQGGAGTLTISGNNTLNNITNSVTPATISFTAASVNTFANFNLNGTAGNLVTINSTVSGTRATVYKSSGTVSVDYLSISDNNATGGATWGAGFNSVDVGNNLGWIFGAIPTVNGNFFFLFT